MGTFSSFLIGLLSAVCQAPHSQVGIHRWQRQPLGLDETSFTWCLRFLPSTFLSCPDTWTLNTWSKGASLHALGAAVDCRPPRQLCQGAPGTFKCRPQEQPQPTWEQILPSAVSWVDHAEALSAAPRRSRAHSRGLFQAFWPTNLPCWSLQPPTHTLSQEPHHQNTLSAHKLLSQLI